MTGSVEGYVKYVLRHKIVQDKQPVLPPVGSNLGWVPRKEEDRQRAVDLLYEAGFHAEWGEEWVSVSTMYLTKLPRYACETKWWELVEPPPWIGRFWFTDMLWNLTVHRSCALDTYHSARSKEEAQVMAYNYVTSNMPGPQVFVRIRVRRM